MKDGDVETLSWRHGHRDMAKESLTWRHGHGHRDMENRKQKTEAQAIILNPFIVCSSRKWKFVRLSVCSFVRLLT
jgi:hypothetical protein